MDATAGDIEPVTLSDILESATWSRERSDDELREFVGKRHELIDTSDLLADLGIV